MPRTADELPPKSRPTPGPIRFVPPDSEWAALILIVALAAGLRLVRLERVGTGHPYYAAAVRAMLVNGRNFAFAAFDPEGVLSVEKPPVALWIQAATAKVLGYRGSILLLPQALMGVGSVLLTWQLARRAFGMGVGLLAALILATMPGSVAVDRDNLPDTALVLVLLLAAWMLSRAAETGRWWPLLAMSALLGVGYNIKLLDAFVVLPTFAGIFAFAAPLSQWARAGRLALAGVVLLVVSLGWSLAVELTPPARRPYLGGSETNSALEWSWIADGWSARKKDRGNLGSIENLSREAGAKGSPPWLAEQILRARPSPPGWPHARGMPSRGEDGAEEPARLPPNPPGPLRFLRGPLPGQVTWFIPVALVGLASLSGSRRGIPLERRQGISLGIWSGWLLSFWAMLSFLRVGFQDSDAVVMGPAVAILASAGLLRMAGDLGRGGFRGVMLPLALALTAAWQAFLIWPSTVWRPWMVPAVAGGAAVAALLLLAWSSRSSRSGESWAQGAFWVGLAALMVAPCAWSITPILGRVDPLNPVASPSLVKGGGPGAKGGEPAFGLAAEELTRPAAAEKLLNYLREQRRGERFLVASASSMAIAPLIVASGEPAMGFGGWTGRDEVFHRDQFVSLVESGQLRFVLLEENASTESGLGQGAGSRNREILDWVRGHGKPVDRTLWGFAEPGDEFFRRGHRRWDHPWDGRRGWREGNRSGDSPGGVRPPHLVLLDCRPEESTEDSAGGPDPQAVESGSEADPRGWGEVPGRLEASDGPRGDARPVR